MPPNFSNTPMGVYRERLAGGATVSVLITDAHESFFVSADRYVREGYTPAFNTLPWKADYDAKDGAPQS